MLFEVVLPLLAVSSEGPHRRLKVLAANTRIRVPEPLGDSGLVEAQADDGNVAVFIEDLLERAIEARDDITPEYAGRQ